MTIRQNVTSNYREEDIHTIGRSLPDVNRGAGQGMAARRVHDCAVHVYDLAVAWCVEAKAGSVLPRRSIRSPKRTQDSRRSRLVRVLRRSAESDVVDKPAASPVSSVALSRRTSRDTLTTPSRLRRKAAVLRFAHRCSSARPS